MRTKAPGSAAAAPLAEDRPRALIFAYAAQPGRGSEPGAGWAVVRATARFADCVVLVEGDHIPGIREWERVHGSPGLTFVGVESPLPANLKRGHRIGRFITYLAWLRAAGRVARRLHAEEPFDFAQHATYAAYWLPSPVVDLSIPSVWGPVAGGVTAPVRLWKALGAAGLWNELLDVVAIRAAGLLPRTRRTWRRATIRIVQNEETRDRLPWRRDGLPHVLSVASFHEIPRPPEEDPERFVVFPSGLIARKCPELALLALCEAPGVRLLFAHGGPKEDRLRAQARKMGLEDRVSFLGPIPRSELFKLVSRASAVVFSGVCEEGGAALAEAMLLGAPVVVLAVGGARTIAERGVDPGRVALVEPSTPSETARELGRAMEWFVRHPAVRRDSNLDREAAMTRYELLLRSALEREPRRAPALTPGKPTSVAVEVRHAQG